MSARPRAAGLSQGCRPAAPDPLPPSSPTFLRAMLRWHSARLCRSCWPRASRSSSRRLSRSSCWNSRSSNSLASISSASASFGHRRAQGVTPSGRAPPRPAGGSPAAKPLAVPPRPAGAGWEREPWQSLSPVPCDGSFPSARHQQRHRQLCPAGEGDGSTGHRPVRAGTPVRQGVCCGQGLHRPSETSCAHRTASGRRNAMRWHNHRHAAPRHRAGGWQSPRGRALRRINACVSSQPSSTSSPRPDSAQGLTGLPRQNRAVLPVGTRYTLLRAQGGCHSEAQRGTTSVAATEGSRAPGPPRRTPGPTPSAGVPDPSRLRLGGVIRTARQGRRRPRAGEGRPLPENTRCWGKNAADRR